MAKWVFISERIESCQDCPHYSREQDMSATIPWCGKLKQPLDLKNAWDRFPIPPVCPLSDI